MGMSGITEVVAPYYSSAFVYLQTFSFNYEHYNCLSHFR